MPKQITVFLIVSCEADASDNSLGSHAVDSLGTDPHDGVICGREVVEPQRLRNTGRVSAGGIAKCLYLRHEEEGLH